MKPDVIVTWPTSCDYPLWRAFIRRERERFAKVIVVFHQNHGKHDYSGFVREQLGDIAILSETTYAGWDWRDSAVNTGLQISDAKWVWFTEQDFIITNPERFWDYVNIPTGMDGFGWQEHNPRWHPSSLFVDRYAIDRTSRYFGPVPVDHFYVFGLELEEIGELPGGTFRHLQGTSDNHRLLDDGHPEAIFKPDQFRDYLRDCLNAGVPLEPGWKAQARAYVG